MVGESFDPSIQPWCRLKITGERTGFTMVELVVVVGVISALIGITLVGVMAARESSRKAQCQNNLRQMGLSMIMIVDRKHRLPSLAAVEVPPKYPSSNPTIGNPFVAIAIEMSFPCVTVNGDVRCDNEDRGESFPPSPFRCPSADQRLGYRLNCGSEPLYNLRRVTDTTRFYSGFRMRENLISSISDGLSNTIMLSERFSHDGSKRFPQAIAIAESNNAEVARSDCADSIRQQLVSETVGRWSSFQVYECGYTHHKPPNDHEFDCVAAIGGMPQTTLMLFISSRSNHSGGVFSAFLDGSVRWIDSKIDLPIWRALGTHSGNEVILN